MSKLDSLKQQYPELSVSIIDVLARLDTSKTHKYLPMFCKMICNYRDNQRWSENDKKELGYSLTTKNIKYTETEALDFKYLLALSYTSDNIPRDIFDEGKNFMEYMERGLIENKDVLTYTSIDDMKGVVALASLRAQSKELEKQVVKVHEDDEWLVVRPLTFEASAKYGYGTKWCTTYQSEKNYFARYWKRGILAYFINKTNGSKWGMFKNLNQYHEDELSWWNVTDKRVDFLEINFNEKMYGVVKTLLQSKQSNKELCDKDLQYRVLVECDPSELKLSSSNVEGNTHAIPPPYPPDYPTIQEPLVRETENMALRVSTTTDPTINRLTEEFQQMIDQHIVEQIRNLASGTAIANTTVTTMDQRPDVGYIETTHRA